MASIALILAFFGLCAAGVLAAHVLSPTTGRLALSVIGALAGLTILAFAGWQLLGVESFHAQLWTLFPLGTLSLGADPLSALFLFAAGLVFLPVSIFSGRYLGKYAAQYDLRYFGILYHSLLASIVLVVLAGDVLTFFIAWELMSIASYLLVTFEYRHEESSRASYVMLAMSEAGTIAAMVALLLLATHAGTFDFTSLKTNATSLPVGLRWAVFLLSFFGFAVKAGLVPLNSWLPLAHPVAPTNVSALLSAVIVNLGIYGIVRVNLDLAPPPAPVAGMIVLVIGSVSALVGILYATVQAEMKRLLAHSTIENMGIITAGLGAAMIFSTTGHPVAAGIALIAAFYHLVNHSAYKALLFIGTGAVEAGTGTRDLDQLGGIARQMPWTGAFFLVGVLAISALPPFNGFVSEWLTLQTILRSALLTSTSVKIVFAVSGAMLALTAGLAVTCFAKVYAMGFLGMSRSEGASSAKDAPWSSRAPMALLAACCVVLGVLPTFVIPALDRAGTPLVHESAMVALVPPFFVTVDQQRENVPAKFVREFHDLGAQIGQHVIPGRGLVVLHRGEEQNPVVFAMSTSYMAVALTIILGATYLAFRTLTARRTLSRRPAWAGGMRRLLPTATYTATGFSNPVRVIFENILSPEAGEDNVEAVARHFRTAIVRNHATVHIVDRLFIEPPVHQLRAVSSVVRRMHVGHVNAYVGYVLFAVLVVLLIGVGLR